MSNSSSGLGGLSFGGVLFIVFLVLKLTNYIDWSWWWVTAPLWMPISFCVLLLAGAFFILGRKKFKDIIFGR